MINFSKLKDEIYNEIKEIKKQKKEELLMKDGEEMDSKDLENMDDINNKASISSTSPFNVVEKFKLPIFYLQEKYRLSESIKNDLEILDFIFLCKQSGVLIVFKNHKLNLHFFTKIKL